MSDLERMIGEIEAYYFDIQNEKRNDEFVEIKDRKGSRRWDSLMRAMATMRELEKEEKHNFKKRSEEELADINLEILKEIAGNFYMPSIQNMIQNTKYFKKRNAPMDAMLFYQMNNGAIQNMEIRITNAQDYIGIFLAIHEYQHALLLEKNMPYNQMYGNIHYHEFPSIFVEKIAAQYVEEEVGEKDFQRVAERIRLRDDYQHVTVTNYPFLSSRLSLLTEYYAAHQGATYILSDMYATRLFDLYKQDKVTVLSAYRRFLKGEISILQLFKDFDISIKNNETYFGYQKKLEFHKNFNI